jgi:hypothetical protein
MPRWPKVIREAGIKLELAASGERGCPALPLAALGNSLIGDPRRPPVLE